MKVMLAAPVRSGEAPETSCTHRWPARGAGWCAHGAAWRITRADSSAHRYSC